MTIRNGYCTLAEYKAYAATRGVTSPVDSSDDAVLETMIEAASRRYEDDNEHYQFYPTIETRSYDVPGISTNNQLWFDHSLCEVLSATNGDATTITSAQYVLLPPNMYPKYGMDLVQSANISWEAQADGDYRQVISISAIWATHDRYSTDGWILGGTLSEALDTAELGFDITTSVANFSPGQIIKIDNELCLIASIASLTLTVAARGDNGSTAATHDSGANVRYWSPMTQVKQAVLEMVNKEYAARYETSLGATNPARRWQTEGSKI
jgi:hypothetical protein